TTRPRPAATPWPPPAARAATPWIRPRSPEALESFPHREEVRRAAAQAARSLGAAFEAEVLAVHALPEPLLAEHHRRALAEGSRAADAVGRLTGHTLRAQPVEVGAVELPAAISRAQPRAIYLVFPAAGARAQGVAVAAEPFNLDVGPVVAFATGTRCAASAALPVAADQTEIAAGATDDLEPVLTAAGASSFPARAGVIALIANACVPGRAGRPRDAVQAEARAVDGALQAVFPDVQDAAHTGGRLAALVGAKRVPHAFGHRLTSAASVGEARHPRAGVPQAAETLRVEEPRQMAIDAVVRPARAEDDRRAKQIRLTDGSPRPSA